MVSTVEWSACLALAAILWALGRLQPTHEGRTAMAFWAGQIVLCAARIMGSAQASEGNSWGVALSQWALCMQAWCFFWGAKHWLAAHAPLNSRWQWVADLIDVPWTSWAIGWWMTLGALAPLIVELSFAGLGERTFEALEKTAALASLGATLSGYAAGCLALARSCPPRKHIGVIVAPILIAAWQACATWISINPAYAAGRGLALDLVMAAALGFLGLSAAREWTRQQEEENTLNQQDSQQFSALAKNLLEMSSSPMWIWSAPGVLVANAAVEKILPPKHAIVPKTLPEALAALGRWGTPGGWGSDAERAEEWAAATELALQTGRAQSPGRWRSAPDAHLTERRGRWELRPVGHAGTERPTDWILSWEDHEAARQLARTTASAASKMNALVNSLPQMAAFGLGGKGEITLWSGRSEALFGQSEATALGSDWCERDRLLASPTGPALPLGEWAKSKAPLPETQKAWVATHGKEPHPVSLMLTRLPASRPGETEIWGFAFSLEAENRLERSNHAWGTRWEALETLSPAGWFLLGPNGALEKASPQYLKWFGLSETEAKEGRWADSMENPPKALQAWRQTLRSRRFEKGRWRVQTPQGWRWIETQVMPIEQGAHFWGWMGCVKDLGAAEAPPAHSPFAPVEAPVEGGA